MLVTNTHQFIPTVKVSQDPFDEKSITRCMLCIEIDESRFRFCFIEEKSNRCVWLEDYAFDTFLNEEKYLEKLKRLVAGHPYLPSDQWKDIRVAVNAHEFTLVPAPLFRKEYASDYLQLATGWPVNAGNRVMYQYSENSNAYTIFSVPIPWTDWLLNLFPLQNIEFYHLVCPLIIGALDGHNGYDCDCIVTIHIEQDYFTMILTEKAQLKFCNRFPYKNPSELAYLILFSMNQLGVSPNETPVKLYGEITPYSDLYTELARFIPELQFGKNPESLLYIDNFEDIPEHRYFGLLNTYLVHS